MACFQYPHTNMTWTKHGYGSLGALQLSSIIIAFLVILFGFYTIFARNRLITLIFSILCFISAGLIFAVGILCFISVKMRYWRDYLGCNAHYNGYLTIWNSVDTYLQLVDEYLCGPECPCYFNENQINIYTTNSTTMPYFGLWYNQDNSDSIKTAYERKNIDYCCDYEGECKKKDKKALHQLLKTRYVERNAYYNNTFNIGKFHKYYSHIEKHFKCTGFCGTTYNNTNTLTNQKIVKYLFSDMSNKIPEHFGCVGALMDWLRKMLVAYGILCVLLFVALIVLLIVVLFNICYEGFIENEDENKVRDKEKEEEEEEGEGEGEGKENKYVLKSVTTKAMMEKGLIKNDFTKPALVIDNIGGDIKRSLESSSKEKNSLKKVNSEIKSTGQDPANTSYIPTQEKKDEINFNFVPSDAL